MIVDFEAFQNAPVGGRLGLRHAGQESRHLIRLAIEDVHHYDRTLRTQGVVGDGPTGTEGGLEQAITGFELVPGHGTLEVGGRVERGRRAGNRPRALSPRG